MYLTSAESLSLLSVCLILSITVFVLVQIFVKLKQTIFGPNGSSSKEQQPALKLSSFKNRRRSSQSSSPGVAKSLKQKCNTAKQEEEEEDEEQEQEQEYISGMAQLNRWQSVLQEMNLHKSSSSQKLLNGSPSSSPSSPVSLAKNKDDTNSSYVHSILSRFQCNVQNLIERVIMNTNVDENDENELEAIDSSTMISNHEEKRDQRNHLKVNTKKKSEKWVEKELDQLFHMIKTHVEVREETIEYYRSILSELLDEIALLKNQWMTNHIQMRKYRAIVANLTQNDEVEDEADEKDEESSVWSTYRKICSENGQLKQLNQRMESHWMEVKQYITDLQCQKSHYAFQADFLKGEVNRLTRELTTLIQHVERVKQSEKNRLLEKQEETTGKITSQVIQLESKVHQSLSFIVNQLNAVMEQQQQDKLLLQYHIEEQSVESPADVRSSPTLESIEFQMKTQLETVQRQLEELSERQGNLLSMTCKKHAETQSTEESMLRSELDKVKKENMELHNSVAQYRGLYEQEMKSNHVVSARNTELEVENYRLSALNEELEQLISMVSSLPHSSTSTAPILPSDSNVVATGNDDDDWSSQYNELKESLIQVFESQMNQYLVEPTKRLQDMSERLRHLHDKVDTYRINQPRASPARQRYSLPIITKESPPPSNVKTTPQSVVTPAAQKTRSSTASVGSTPLISPRTFTSRSDWF